METTIGIEIMQDTFRAAFEKFQLEAYQINAAHGFNETDALIEQFREWLLWKAGKNSYDKFEPLVGAFRQARTGLKLSLIMSELGETVDGIRKGNLPDNHIPEFSSEEAELADAVIRIMNLATDDKCRLAEAIVAKQNYNRNRPYRHGGKQF